MMWRQWKKNNLRGADMDKGAVGYLSLSRAPLETDSSSSLLPPPPVKIFSTKFHSHSHASPHKSLLLYLQNPSPWQPEHTNPSRPPPSALQTLKLMEVEHAPEVVNCDPSFGSSLFDDNFAQKPADIEITVPDPLKLETEAVAEKLDSSTDSTSAGAMDLLKRETEPMQDSTLEPLLQNPDGATQLFTDMHGLSGGLEGKHEILPADSGMRHMAGLTNGAQRLGNTDWGCGTDGGLSGKPQDGVPYGSFTGVGC